MPVNAYRCRVSWWGSFVPMPEGGPGPDRFQCYWPRVLLVVQPLQNRKAYLHATIHNLLCRFGDDVFYDRGVWFADLTHHQHQGGPVLRVQHINARLSAHGSFAVGAAPGLALTRYAGAVARPDAPCVLAPWQLAAALESVPLCDVLSWFPGAVQRLASEGVTRCGAFMSLTPDAVRRRWGEPGRRWWNACYGLDSELPVTARRDWPQFAVTMVLPPRTRTHKALQGYVRSSCQRLARQLDRRDMLVRRLDISLLTVTGREISWQAELRGGLLQAAACFPGLQQHWQGQAIARIQLAAGDVAHRAGQLSLFAA